MEHRRISSQIIETVVKEYGASFVKPIKVIGKQKLIAYFKTKDALMKALGKSLLKNKPHEQWQVRISGDKFKPPTRKIRELNKKKLARQHPLLKKKGNTQKSAWKKLEFYKVKRSFNA